VENKHLPTLETRKESKRNFFCKKISFALFSGFQKWVPFYFPSPYTQRIADLGLRIAESIDNQHIPQFAIPNPKSIMYRCILNSLKFLHS
jgi:hypothetical protein